MVRHYSVDNLDLIVRNVVYSKRSVLFTKRLKLHEDNIGIVVEVGPFVADTTIKEGLVPQSLEGRLFVA